MRYLSLWFILIAAPAVSQNVMLYGKAIQTVKGATGEAGIGLELKNKIAAGAFFQSMDFPGRESSSRPANSFYGGYLHIPFLKDQKIMVGGLLQAGLVNRRFFIVTPSIETRMRIGQKAGATIGAGYRHGYPSASVGLLYMVPFKK